MPYEIQFRFQHLAVPAVACLIAFLAYVSQIFVLPYLEPGPLSQNQKWKFNLLVGSIWVTYYRAITVNPGKVPENLTKGEGKDSKESDPNSMASSGEKLMKRNGEIVARQRYCRKCECLKPPRTHHCKVCKRCIPKMDHHCPWTANCVSHFTFPHFMRFLLYAVVSICYLEYFLYVRVATLWDNRNLPSYLGPSVTQIVLLFMLMGTNSLTLFALSIIFLRTTYDLLNNTTTIETWEIERHQQLLRRSRALGGYLDGPDGMRIRITKQEFPYDVGIWANVVQSMGSGNPLNWIWVFARTRKDSGVEFETNGFEDPSIGWPPPDPDRMPRLQRSTRTTEGDGFVHEGRDVLSPLEEIAAFKRRQEEDLLRKRQFVSGMNAEEVRVLRRKPFRERFDENSQLKGDIELSDQDGDLSGEEGWADSGGSRLKDYGVDEEVEFYDEDELPLAELMRRRQKQ